MGTDLLNYVMNLIFLNESVNVFDELACKKVAVTGTSPAPPLNVHLILAIWSHHIILIIH